MSVVTVEMQNQVSELYITFFGRAPDAEGMGHWVQALANGATVQQIGEAFARSDEFVSNYGALTPEQAVNKFYMNTLNRPADADGMTYWTNLIGQGVSFATVAYSIVNTAFNGAGNPDVNPADVALVNNKVTIAKYFSIDLASNDFALAQTAFVGITDDPATVVAKEAELDAEVNAGTTYTLTTGVDNVVGTSKNDTVIGTFSETAGGDQGGTLTPGDTINLEGGVNRMNLTVSGAGNPISDPFAAVSIQNVQNFYIQDVGTGATATTYSFAGITGEQQVWSNLSTQNVAFTNLAAGTTIGVVGNGALTNGSVSATYATGATAAAIAVSGSVVGAAGISVTNATGITDVTIDASGATTTAGAAVGAIALSGGNTVKNATINASTKFVSTGLTGFATTGTSTLTVNGAGAVEVGTLQAALDVVNASGNTGGFTATLGSTTATVTGGAGNDIISTGQVLTTGSVDAGAGTGDQLRVTADAAVASTTLGAKYSNFEILGVEAGVSVDVDNLTANNTFTGARYATGGTITDMTATMAQNVTAVGNGTYVFGIKGATDPGTNNTLVVDVNDGSSATNTINLGSFTAAGIENITLNATDNVTVEGLTNAADLLVLTLTGSKTFDITTGALAVNPSFGVAAGDATGAITFNADASTTRGFAITTGSAADTVIMSDDGLVDIINLGAGNDTVYADGQGTAEVQTITVATTADAASVLTVTFNGVQTLVSVALSDTAAAIATKIEAALEANDTYTNAGYDFSVAGAVVTLTANQQSGAIADATVTEGTAIATTFTVAESVAGALPSVAVDTLTLGAGDDTVYVVSNTQATIDKILDLDLGTSTTSVDILNFTNLGATKTVVTATAGQVTDIAAQTSLANAITYVLTNVADTDGDVGIFTYSGKDYLIMNGDGGATWTDGVDAIVDITGYTGTLNAGDFNFI